MADELIRLSPLATETIGKLQARVEALEKALGLAWPFIEFAKHNAFGGSYEAWEAARELLEKK